MDRSTDLDIQELKVRGPAAAALAFRSAALASRALLAASRRRWSSRRSRGMARGHLGRGIPRRSALPGPRRRRRLSLALPRGAALRVVAPAGGHSVLSSRVSVASGLQDPRLLGVRTWSMEVEAAPSLSEVARFPGKVVRDARPLCLWSPLVALLSHSCPRATPEQPVSVRKFAAQRCLWPPVGRDPSSHHHPHHFSLDGHCLGREGVVIIAEGGREDRLRGPLLACLHQLYRQTS